MKITTRSIFTVFLLFVSLYGVSQPNITANTIASSPGVYGVSQMVAYPSSVGASGANAVWDFTSLTSTGSSNMSFVAPSSTAYASFFPNATLATPTTTGNGSGYAYCDVDASGFVILGTYDTSPTLTRKVTYSDPETQIPAPFTYNSTQTHSLAATIDQNVSGNITSFSREGSTIFVGDGYGTLKLPNATINNVLRIKWIRTMQDSYMGTPFYTYTDTGYLWVSPAVKIPLLSLYKLTANGQ
ncbi:MAG: hypothetical protein ACKVTZ_16635, partial [Bacteroidia bacterium]